MLGECVELHVWLGLRSLGIGFVLRWSKACYIWLTTGIQQLSINLLLPTYILSPDSCTLDINYTVCAEYMAWILWNGRRCRSFSTDYLGSTSIMFVDGNLPVELLCILSINSTPVDSIMAMYLRRLIRSVPYKPCPLSTELLLTTDLVDEDHTPHSKSQHFYPVRLYEILNNRYQVAAKIGWRTSSTVWLARDL